MILPIYLYGSGVLRKKSLPIDIAAADKDEIKKYIADLFETMAASEGVGLAAPQVGRDVRILVVDGTDLTDTYPALKDFKRAMINPEIIEKSEETSTYSEGCLSIPDIHCDVTRPKKITVHYWDDNLDEKTEELDDFAARMVWHEMDHLDGILFTDHVAPIRKKLISSKLHNISKGKVRCAYKAKIEK